jgi:hypothetical protein
MPVDLRLRPEVWTYRGPKPSSVAASGRLAAAVIRKVEPIEYKHHPPYAAFDEAVEPLSGARLTNDFLLSAKITKTTLKARLKRLEKAYGLEDLSERRDHRPARALLLHAAEYRIAPLIEGLLSATDWGPTSTRLDLRAAFHLVSRWWTQNEPRVLSRLAITALSLKDDHVSDPDSLHYLPYLPITRLYEGVLGHHRETDLVAEEARLLSAETTRVLYDAYWHRRTKREIMRALFLAAEDLRLIEQRLSFDIEPALRRREEITRIMLDLDLGVRPDELVSQSIVLLGRALET